MGRLGLVETIYAVGQSNSLIPFSVSLQIHGFVITQGQAWKTNHHIITEED